MEPGADTDGCSLLAPPGEAWQRCCESPKCWAASRWLLPWIKTQVRISSRSVTGYTFPYLRLLEFSFEYSGVFGPVAHFWISEWLTLMIAFTGHLAEFCNPHQFLQEL